MRWHRGMEKQRVNAVVEGLKNALCFAVLLACVRAREAKDSAVLGEQRAEREIVKFSPIVSL